VTQTHLITAPYRELWKSVKSAVVIDGIGLDGKVFVDDPSIELKLVKSPEILCEVDDPEFAKFQRDGEAVFQELIRELNRVHETAHGERFWRIVCGAWFLQFAQVWYLRWKVANTVHRSFGELICPKIGIQWQELLPVTHDEASLLFATDVWNHIAYVEAYEFVSRANNAGSSDASGKVSVVNEVSSPRRSDELAEYRKVINNGLPKSTQGSKLESILAKISPRPKVVLAGVVQTKLALVAMHLRLGMLPRLWRFTGELSAHDVDLKIRAEFMQARQDLGDFRHFLHQAVSRHLPSIYLEGYQELVAVAARHNQLAKAPKAIFTNTLLARNEQFKVWCATFVTQHGTKLFSGQHGGGYLVSRFFGWNEIYELTTVDKFLVWGKKPSLQVAAGTCVQSVAEEFSNLAGGDLLVVLGPVTRNSDIYRMLGVQSNSSYFEILNRFVSSLEDGVRSKTLIRPKNASSTRKPARVAANQLTNVFSEPVAIDEGGLSLTQRLKNSRLAVVTYNETTIPANMIADFPTIALWDPKYVRLNDQAEAVYEQLRRAKMLFHSPQDAAVHVNEIWPDIDAWWHSSGVRRARENYCLHYAHEVRFPALTVAGVIADNL